MFFYRIRNTNKCLVLVNYGQDSGVVSAHYYVACHSTHIQNSLLSIICDESLIDFRAALRVEMDAGHC